MGTVIETSKSAFIRILFYIISMDTERQNLQKTIRNIFFCPFDTGQTIAVWIHRCLLYTKRKSEVEDQRWKIRSLCQIVKWLSGASMGARAIIRHQDKETVLADGKNCLETSTTALHQSQSSNYESHLNVIFHEVVPQIFQQVGWVWENNDLVGVRWMDDKRGLWCHAKFFHHAHLICFLVADDRHDCHIGFRAKSKGFADHSFQFHPRKRGWI